MREEGEGIRGGWKEYMQQIKKEYRVESTLKGVSGMNNVLASQSRSQSKHYENNKSDQHSFTHTNRKEISVV